MSGASRLSKAGKEETKNNRFDDRASMTSSQGRKTEVYSELDENDEWTAI